MSVALKLSKFVVMTMNPKWGETPRYVWAVDAQDAVIKAKEQFTKGEDEEIMEVFKAVKGWKK